MGDTYVNSGGYFIWDTVYGNCLICPNSETEPPKTDWSTDFNLDYPGIWDGYDIWRVSQENTKETNI